MSTLLTTIGCILGCVALLAIGFFLGVCAVLNHIGTVVQERMSGNYRPLMNDPLMRYLKDRIAREVAQP
jgi:hypothetical protein